MTQTRTDPAPAVPPATPQHRPLSYTIRLILLNLLFWTIAPLVTLVFAMIAIPYATLFGLIRRNRRKTLRLIRRSISYYGAAIIRCGWPLVRFRYVDHAPHETPPFVFVSNHRSSSDAFLMACLPFECIQVLNNWPSRIPVIGILSRIAGYLKVREMPFDDFVRAGSSLLADGVSIIAFPEGTRSGSRNIGQFHGSAFRLAQQSHVKIVPLAISGNENIPSRGSLLLHPGFIVISKLPAVTPEHYENMNAYKLKTEVRDMIRRQLDAQST